MNIVELFEELGEMRDPALAELKPLSNRDREFFLNLIENPPAPNAAFIAAARRYKERHAPASE